MQPPQPAKPPYKEKIHAATNRKIGISAKHTMKNMIKKNALHLVLGGNVHIKGKA